MYEYFMDGTLMKTYPNTINWQQMDFVMGPGAGARRMREQTNVFN